MRSTTVQRRLASAGLSLFNHYSTLSTCTQPLFRTNRTFSTIHQGEMFENLSALSMARFATLLNSNDKVMDYNDPSHLLVLYISRKNQRDTIRDIFSANTMLPKYDAVDAVLSKKKFTTEELLAAYSTTDDLPAAQRTALYQTLLMRFHTLEQARQRDFNQKDPILWDNCADFATYMVSITPFPDMSNIIAAHMKYMLTGNLAIPHKAAEIVSARTKYIDPLTIYHRPYGMYGVILYQNEILKLLKHHHTPHSAAGLQAARNIATLWANTVFASQDKTGGEYTTNVEQTMLYISGKTDNRWIKSEKMNVVEANTSIRSPR